MKKQQEKELIREHLKDKIELKLEDLKPRDFDSRQERPKECGEEHRKQKRDQMKSIE